QLVLLIRFVERTNVDLTRFLEAITYADFSQTFIAKGKGSTFDDLDAAFNSVMSEFRKVRGDREEQYHFLQTLIQHVPVGLVSFAPDGEIGIINAAAKRLLRVTHLTTLRALEPASPHLTRALRSLRPGDRVTFKLDDFPEPLHLVMNATEIRLHERPYTLVSLQNIQSELDDMEMEAWQKLIRVLTHEIMNSVTPISSLSSTAAAILQKEALSDNEHDVRSDLTDLREAMVTITRRSEGLLHFVDAYRNLTLIPKPVLRIFAVKDLVQRVDLLLRTQAAQAGATLSTRVEPESLEVNADPDLMEQVLINLVQNAFHAVQETRGGRIHLSGLLDRQGRVEIEVSDNGKGIPEDAMEKIFVPFYTTKEKGSGIGLSLSRQIVRMHGGTLTCRSKPGDGAVFTIRF
ncbi:MAG: ATP-binding protein, partial [Bacteroidetes bacterium]|nr:ATP-binding protein [Bacteroidota bacterium]